MIKKNKNIVNNIEESLAKNIHISRIGQMWKFQ